LSDDHAAVPSRPARSGLRVGLVTGFLSLFVVLLLLDAVLTADNRGHEVMPTIGHYNLLKRATPLERAAGSCAAGIVTDGGDRLFLTTARRVRGPAIAELADVRCVLQALHAPVAVRDAVTATTTARVDSTGFWSADVTTGSGSAARDGYFQATWAHHPGTALDVVITYQPPFPDIGPWLIYSGR
jgi:hypothetical protein